MHWRELPVVIDEAASLTCSARMSGDMLGDCLPVLAHSLIEAQIFVIKSAHLIGILFLPSLDRLYLLYILEILPSFDMVQQLCWNVSWIF